MPSWFLLAALVATPIRDDLLDPWELDAYVGYTGFLLLCLGIIPFRQSAKRFLNVLLLPTAALILLSLGDAYERTLFRLPGFVSERVTSRFIILPILWLTLAGCGRIDAWWRRAERPLARSLLVLLAVWFLAVQLVLRAQVWRPRRLLMDCRWSPRPPWGPGALFVGVLVRCRGIGR
jgi:hypothetical protein